MNWKKILGSKVFWIVIAALVVIILIMVLFMGGTRGLNKPESVVYDAVNDRYLVSNNGNGSIVSVDPKGKVSPFITGGMVSPKGMYLKHPLLYVADVDQIRAIDVANKRLVASYPIEGALMLADLCADDSDKLYITDIKANCIFIFDINTKSLQKITHPLISMPNGIVYDHPRRQVMFVGFGNQASILTYNIYTATVETFMESAYSQLDGILIDDLGRIFFSTWKEGMIVMIPQEQNRFVPVVRNLKSPADFALNPLTHELVIPLYARNRIVRHKIEN